MSEVWSSASTDQVNIEHHAPVAADDLDNQARDLLRFCKQRSGARSGSLARGESQALLRVAQWLVRQCQFNRDLPVLPSQRLGGRDNPIVILDESMESVSSVL